MDITLEQPARARLDHRGGPGAARARHACATTPTDPLAVHVDFPPEVSLDGQGVTWTFARALLEEGVAARPAAVTCTSGRAAGTTVVEFHSPYGLALLQFDTPALRRFLLRTLRRGRRRAGGSRRGRRPGARRPLRGCLSGAYGGLGRAQYRRTPAIPSAPPSVPSGTKRTSAPVSRHCSTISSTMSSRASRSPLSAGTRWSPPSSRTVTR